MTQQLVLILSIWNVSTLSATAAPTAHITQFAHVMSVTACHSAACHSAVGNSAVGNSAVESSADKSGADKTGAVKTGTAGSGPHEQAAEQADVQVVDGKDAEGNVTNGEGSKGKDKGDGDGNKDSGESSPLFLPKTQGVTPTPVDGIEPREFPSGLRLWRIREGEGKRPTPDSRVAVHYTGWLEDGRVYISTRDQEAPTIIELRRAIIKGLEEGVGYMKKGERCRLEIPPSLAFGERGYYRRVPPNETLTFEIELIDVIHPPKPSSREGKEAHKTDTGLVYWDIKEGTGSEIGTDGIVTIRYSRWTMGGELIDTSEFDDEHANVLLSQVIKGWREGIAGMKVGGIRQMQIPPELAFGKSGWKPIVGPDESIISEVKVVGLRTLPPRQANPTRIKREMTPDAYRTRKEKAESDG